MNYKKHYSLLIDRAKARTLSGYKERHHILPVCMGGSDSRENLADLTAREHFIAHLLLVKIYNNNLRLVRAVEMMCVGQKERKITNRLYGKMRERWKSSMSECQTLDGNSQWGTKWIHNTSLKKSQKIPKNEIIPDGWKIGRIIKFDKVNKRLLREEKQIKTARELYEKYSAGNFTSIRNFCELGNYEYSHVSLTLLWKKYIPEYKVKAKRGKRFIPW